jgi:hypothetical protein
LSSLLVSMEGRYRQAILNRGNDLAYFDQEKIFV